MSHQDLARLRVFIPLTRAMVIRATDIHILTDTHRITVIRRLSVLVLHLRSDMEDGEADTGITVLDGDIEVVGATVGGGDMAEVGVAVVIEGAVGGIGTINGYQGRANFIIATFRNDILGKEPGWSLRSQG
ncbi:MAG: hypothetical protein ACU836_07940 [Gammaproteobacteria bacterium]